MCLSQSLQTVSINCGCLSQLLQTVYLSTVGLHVKSYIEMMCALNNIQVIKYWSKENQYKPD